MPYIAPERRTKYVRYEQSPPETGGDLNYVISRLLARFTEYHGLSYTTIAQARDAASGALDEYNRCVAHVYEEQARQKNGDIWGILP